MKFLIAFMLVMLYVQCAGAAEKISLKINGENFSVEVQDNITAQEIFKNVPLALTMTRYAGHEYYSELPFTPSFDSEKTSSLKAGCLYYWDGWNSFVINYEDCDISPYKSVHIGSVDEAEKICAILRSAGGKISITVEK